MRYVAVVLLIMSGMTSGNAATLMERFRVGAKPNVFGMHLKL